MSQRTAYVCFHCRPQDNGTVWPLAYPDPETAHAAPFRVSEVTPVQVAMYGSFGIPTVGADNG